MVGDECLREVLLLRPPVTSSWDFVSPLTFPAPWPPWLCCDNQLPDEIVAREVTAVAEEQDDGVDVNE